jgi:hypothetical protein
VQQSDPPASSPDEASADEAVLLRSVNRTRRAVALVTLAAGAVFLYLAWDLSVGTLARPGPGLMPRLVAFGLLGAAVLALFEPVREGAEVDALPDRAGERRQGLVLVSLAAYAAAIPLAGFLLSTAAVMSLISWILNKDRVVKRALVIGVTVAVVIDLVFRLLLGVNLPAGLWGIATA